MTTRQTRILTALCGILGVALLVASYNLNPGPPPNPTPAQMVAFAHQYRNAILLGAWLQAVSTVLLVAFAVALVHLAGAATRFAGWLTLFGGTVLAMISLVEVAFYLSAINSASPAAGEIGMGLIKAIQHDFSMVAAPALFLPLGAVLLGSRALPRLFGYLALLLGGAFAISGLVYLFRPILPVVTALSIIQAAWFLLAAITLLVRRERAADTAPVAGSAGATAGSYVRGEGTNAR